MQLSTYQQPPLRLYSCSGIYRYTAVINQWLVKESIVGVTPLITTAFTATATMLAGVHHNSLYTLSSLGTPMETSQQPY